MATREQGTAVGDFPARLPLLPPRSVAFFVTILFVPFGLVLPFFIPENRLTWVIVAIGIIAAFECWRKLYEAYFILPDGIARRRLLGRDELKWNEVEAIGLRHVNSGKYGPEGVVISLYSAEKSFRPALKPRDVGPVITLLAQTCPNVVRIDENLATFDVAGKCGYRPHQRNHSKACPPIAAGASSPGRYYRLSCWPLAAWISLFLAVVFRPKTGQ